MQKQKVKKTMSVLLALAITASLAACGKSGAENDESIENIMTETGERDTVIVRIGRQTASNPKLPEGDTYEDNAYIRMAEKELNITIEDAFEANAGDDYNRQVSLALSASSLPDIMQVATKDELTELYENGLIADLTDVYEMYASDYVKSVYDSFDERALNDVTYDGKIMAIPATKPDGGPSMCWIRSDWVEKLGLTVDLDGDHCMTLDEVEKLAEEFIAANPENVEKVIGMGFSSGLTDSNSDTAFSINAIAYSVGAYPRLWYEDESGTLVYGSTTEKMKETLAIVKRWYEEGLIDQQLGTRTYEDGIALLAGGQCGIVFGSWHIPDWMLNNVYALNENAVFEPYAVTDSEGKVNCTHAKATGEYIVVNAEFEHPEIAVQILNLFYDEIGNSPELLERYPEVGEYLNIGVDGTARPFNIEVEASTYMEDIYKELSAALSGSGTREGISSAEERASYDAIMAYMDGSGDITGWCKLHSRYKGGGLLYSLTENNRYHWITPVYPETTSTMNTNWANLLKLEEESFLKIVTGSANLDEGFEAFVSDWNKQGGETILKEIMEQMREE